MPFLTHRNTSNALSVNSLARTDLWQINILKYPAVVVKVSEDLFTGRIHNVAGFPEGHALEPLSRTIWNTTINQNSSRSPSAKGGELIFSYYDYETQDISVVIHDWSNKVSPFGVYQGAPTSVTSMDLEIIQLSDSLIPIKKWICRRGVLASSTDGLGGNLAKEPGLAEDGTFALKFSIVEPIILTVEENFASNLVANAQNIINNFT